MKKLASRFKRMVASVLVGAVVIGTVPVNVYANGLDNVESSLLNTGNVEDFSANKESNEQAENITDTNEADAVIELIEDKEDTKDSLNEVNDIDYQDEELRPGHSLNFVVITEPNLTSGDTQKIALSVGGEEINIENATLTLQKKDSDTEVSVRADAYSTNAALFAYDYSMFTKGIYKISKLVYSVGNERYCIDFGQFDEEYIFGVDTEVDTNPDDVFYEEESNVPESIISDGSKQDTKDAIDSAVSSVGANGIKRAGSEFIVVLDPGHDASHKGNRGCNDAEESITYDIAMAAKAELEQYSNVKVIMTRNGAACPVGGGDNANCLSYRGYLGGQYGATLFVSFHTNSVSGGFSGTATGAEVYYHNSLAAGTTSDQVAGIVLNKLQELGIRMRGVKTANYAVLRYSAELGIPAILIEHAFQDNPNEYNAYLATSSQRQSLGIKDAQGIASYYGLQKGNEIEEYAAVFDASFYWAHNTDLQKGYEKPDSATDAKAYALFNHFINQGMADGRQANLEFNVHYYRNRYSDLRAGFRNDLKAYYMHYINHGKAEGRDGKTPCEAIQNAVTIYNGKDYSSVYDYNYYITKYPDIREGYKGDEFEVLAHFVNHGMSEGRQGSEEFNVTYYKNRYSDLRAGFRNDLKAYYIHYVDHGKKEGRDGKTPCNQILNAVTIYNGKDYSSVYDYNYYITKYPDIREGYKGDEFEVLAHFVNHGMSEGRQGSEEFNVTYYRNRYVDLRRGFGNDLKALFMHYVDHGKKEGRDGKTPCEVIQNAITTYNGTDYSAVYSFYDYLNNYSDLRQAYWNDEDGAISHFVNHGMSEGRIAKNQTSTQKGFNVNSYMNQYVDLRNGFGDDLKAYYLHYMNHGLNEGRVAWGQTIRQGGISTLNGVDYSSIYNYDYYTRTYPDIKDGYGNDDVAILYHFINYGLSEGRTGNGSFYVQSYYNLYPDLRRKFGTDWLQYALHYIREGQAEGRVAYNRAEYVHDSGGYLIMGVSAATPKQMANHYRSATGHDIPAFYNMSSEQFFTYLCEAAADEGVKAEVVYAQSMKETGFLRFGGQVSIEQYNFAGIGATNGGAAGAYFGSVYNGYLAQVQHLKAYATVLPCNKPCVDPRFDLIAQLGRRGRASTVEGLNGLWAVPGDGYGESIVNGYMIPMLRMSPW